MNINRGHGVSRLKLHHHSNLNFEISVLSFISKPIITVIRGRCPIMTEFSNEDQMALLDISDQDANNGNVTTSKRSDFLPWEDYFLAVAFLSAMRSKDPATQVCVLIRMD